MPYGEVRPRLLSQYANPSSYLYTSSPLIASMRTQDGYNEPDQAIWTLSEVQKKVSPQEGLFIEFVLTYIVETNPGYLKQTTQKISQEIDRRFDAQHLVRKHAKQFNQFFDCLQHQYTHQMFEEDQGQQLAIRSRQHVEKAFKSGVISAEAWTAYENGHSIHQAHQDKFKVM